ncbi:DUF221 domain protein [Pseudohyphozyma bogoriensis]|nr:DUF221 domain protein [Pseudohyphozyma bogoriensis]
MSSKRDQERKKQEKNDKKRPHKIQTSSGTAPSSQTPGSSSSGGWHSPFSSMFANSSPAKTSHSSGIAGQTIGYPTAVMGSTDLFMPGHHQQGYQYGSPYYPGSAIPGQPQPHVLQSQQHQQGGYYPSHQPASSQGTIDFGFDPHRSTVPRPEEYSQYHDGQNGAYSEEEQQQTLPSTTYAPPASERKIPRSKFNKK